MYPLDNTPIDPIADLLAKAQEQLATNPELDPKPLEGIVSTDALLKEIYLKQTFLTALASRIEELKLTARILEGETEILQQVLMSKLDYKPARVAGYDINVRASNYVNITAEDKLLPEFLRTKTVTTPNKELIATAIKSGANVPGAELKTRHHLYIK